MAGLPIANPEEIGFVPARVQQAYGLLEQWVKTDKIPSACLGIGRKGRMLEPRFFGRHRLSGDAPLRKDALFLVASITKPVTVTALMMLVERGLLTLEDRVADFVPEFAQNGKKEVQIRHLMTHTSGLPDMVPNNVKLREGHQPLAKFIEEICKVPLLFPPGTGVSYQSAGIAILAEVLRRITGTPLAEFLRKEVFSPLGMFDTSLGWQPDKKDRIAEVHLEDEQKNTDWNWNTQYWLSFGAPWGGLITSPFDFARLCQLMLSGGSVGDVRLLGPATVRAMTVNQLSGMPEVPEVERRCRPWGLGWRLQWPGHSANFGDLLGPRVYGHWGATGTLCWLDPDSESFFILFTTQPQGETGKFLARLSNAVAAALV